jgi:hypothetical protein
MSHAALEWAFHMPLIGHWKGVLVALAQHADAAGRCRPGLERLALFAGIDERSVRRCLRWLELLEDEEGRKAVTVTCSRGGRRASHYLLDLAFIMPADAPRTGPGWEPPAANGHDTRTQRPGNYPDTASPLDANTRTESPPNDKEYPDTESPHPGHSVPPARTLCPPNLHRKVIECKGGSVRGAGTPAPARAPIPEDWQPNAESERYAIDLGLPLDQTVRDFRLHYQAEGKALADWDAKFRQWCEREPTFAQRRAPRSEWRNGYLHSIAVNGFEHAEDASESEDAISSYLRLNGVRYGTA